MRRANAPSVPRNALARVLGALAFAVPGSPTLAADPGPASSPPSVHAPAAAKKAAPAAPIDINSASKAQLKTLPGIGDAEAGRIIAGRPYLSKADLASKKVIPTGIYLSLKDRIIARQKQEPKHKD